MVNLRENRGSVKEQGGMDAGRHTCAITSQLSGLQAHRRELLAVAGRGMDPQDVCV